LVGANSNTNSIVGEIMVARAEPLGYDTISIVEHHFNGYSMCPDNVALLAWLAGQTSKTTGDHWITIARVHRLVTIRRCSTTGAGTAS
jgi:hypothetical protein